MDLTEDDLVESIYNDFCLVFVDKTENLSETRKEVAEFFFIQVSEKILQFANCTKNRFAVRIPYKKTRMTAVLSTERTIVVTLTNYRQA